MTSPQNTPGRRTPQAPHQALTWWLVGLALIAWNVVTLWPRHRPQTVTIPYSTFVGQVKAGNVSKVHIADAEITGAFIKPLLWPQPDASAASKPPKPAPTPPTSSSTQPKPVKPSTPSTYPEFKTAFPVAIGDASLIPLLETRGVQVNVAPQPNPLLKLVLSSALPMIFLVLLLVWIGRRAAKSQAGVFGFGRSKARRYTADRPQVLFTDVAGAEEAKADLEEIVDFLRNPAKYHDIGAHIPRGVLLVGPPGTGKTLLARAVAGEAGVPFFTISASEFVEMFVGVGASRVRDLFEQAKATAPAIVFIDEMDAVGRRRGAGVGAVNDEREQTLNQLLVEMDGFDERHEVIVIGATNRPDVLDPALLRPGRFDRQVVVGLPDRRGREGILRIHTRSLKLTPNVDLEVLARSTTGLSGADLANLCNEAALTAARRNHTDVDMADFEAALDKITLGSERSVLMNPQERKVVAYHEAGHALMAWLTPEADPVHKVTIIPHGQALGVTEQLPGEDRTNYSKAYLLARLAVMLGGRTAEEIAIGDVTTGAESDLVQATRLARRMVTRWAMGSLGTLVLETDEQTPFLGYELAQGRNYSEATAALIDQDVTGLLEERHKAVTALLEKERDKLDRLVQELLKEETVDQNGLTRLLGDRPEPASGSEVRPEGD